MHAAPISIQAPGRICLFGDHQDYLGLPVIACAIDRYLKLDAEPIRAREFQIQLPDLGSQRTIVLDESFEQLHAGDFYGSTLRLLRKKGLLPSQGYQLKISSNIPINAGTSSSSALTVAWMHFLLSSIEGAPQPEAELLAEWSYQAEVVEHSSPGGKMDQYTIAIGDLIYINTSATLDYIQLNTNLEGMVLGESGVPKSTIGVLGDLRGNAQRSIAQVKQNHPSFVLEQATVEQLPELIKCLDRQERPFFEAAVRNHCITQDALLAFQKTPEDRALIGQLMYQHHEILRDLLGLTVPRIDRMIDAAMQAGAYGAKIVGSGGGGSVVALVPPGTEQLVAQAMIEQQAVAAYPVQMGPGSTRTA